ncbi:unnamed protein product, partial [Chrysoparadoxa australica]
PLQAYEGSVAGSSSHAPHAATIQDRVGAMHHRQHCLRRAMTALHLAAWRRRSIDDACLSADSRYHEALQRRAANCLSWWKTVTKSRVHLLALHAEAVAWGRARLAMSAAGLLAQWASLTHLR